MRTGDAEKEIEWRFVLKNESEPSSVAKVNEQVRFYHEHGYNQENGMPSARDIIGYQENMSSHTIRLIIYDSAEEKAE